ncbi:DUF418 domain-containing protein [Veronia nyctiphanis]|uniref:DUF418 domain-containing protein n=1 Tax=Veronia nyctiphanis TaxID=1278244 RepID=UPI001375BA3E|nr:DUF418 domain-containing protein [Veronia nyctiphanis]
MLNGYVRFQNPPLLDEIIDTFNLFFADGRFRSLFCLLFGAGLAIQYESSNKKDIDPMMFIKTRLNWLLLFGFIHAVFIFGGDILMLYAVIGFFVYKKLALEQNVLRNKAIIWYVVGAVVVSAVAGGLLLIPQEELMVRGSPAYLEAYGNWFGNYGYQVLVQGGVALGMVVLAPMIGGIQIAALIMFGAFLYRSGFFERGLSNIQLIFAFVTGMTLSALLFVMTNNFDIELSIINIVSSIPAVFIALVYAHILIKFSQGSSRVIKALANTGRVAFSLYILQSVVMAIALRWIFPEFHFEATRLDYLLIVISYTIFQIFLANVYLSLFRQGPLELLWRKAYLGSVKRKQGKQLKVKVA